MRRVLFVCTGNLCRSPMAEAIAVARFGGDDISFGSAGVAAVDGSPASPAAVEVCAEIGVDAAGHRARQLDRAAAGAADRIYVMTAAHRWRVEAIAPEASDRVELLRPDGRDISDPYGSSAEVYRECRDEILAALEARGGDL